MQFDIIVSGFSWGNLIQLTHWGRVTHKFVSKLTIIGSDNGLSPGRRQAIIWTNAGILWIGPLGTNFSEILIEIYTFSFKKILLKVWSGKWRPSCLGLNVLRHWPACRLTCSVTEGIFCYFLDLTLSMQGPSYLGLIRSISWLLMPRLLASPGHQQPWYWLCEIGRTWSSMRKDSNYLCHVNVEEWHKM